MNNEGNVPHAAIAGNQARYSLAALVVGTGLGFTAHQWPTPTATLLIGWLEPLGALWLAALQMLVVPLVISLLIPVLGRAGNNTPARLGLLTVFWFCVFLGSATVITLALGTALLTVLPVGASTIAAFQDTLPAAIPTATTSAELPGAHEWLAHLIPTNLFQSLAAGDLLGIIVAAALFGIALRFVEANRKDTILRGLDAIAEWCMALAGLLLRLLPMAVFILSLRSAASSGAEIALGLAYYIFWVSALLMLFILLMYPVTAHFSSLTLQKFARAVWPVQLLAFSCRSSLACLPAMLNSARHEMHLPDSVTGFVLPLAVSTFKLNMGVSAIFQMLFLLHVFGIQAELPAVLVASAVLAAQSVATPGLPSGAMWTTTPVYLALGIPLEGIVLTNVVDTIPDLFKTTTNVSGNLSITAIVANRIHR
jgi:proton glutamate symport protein